MRNRQTLPGLASVYLDSLKSDLRDMLEEDGCDFWELPAKLGERLVSMRDGRVHTELLVVFETEEDVIDFIMAQLLQEKQHLANSEPTTVCKMWICENMAQEHVAESLSTEFCHDVNAIYRVAEQYRGFIEHRRKRIAEGASTHDDLRADWEAYHRPQLHPELTTAD